MIIFGQHLIKLDYARFSIKQIGDMTIFLDYLCITMFDDEFHLSKIILTGSSILQMYTIIRISFINTN